MPSPLGAARLLFLAEQAARDPVLAEEAALREAAARLPANEDRDAVVYLAWELARRARELPPREAHALFLVLVACVAEERRGSTHLPMAALPAHLQALGASAGDRAAALALLDGRDPRMDAVVGRPGLRRPLLRVGDDLYLERMFFYEERLVAKLAGRTRGPRPCAEDDAKAALAGVDSAALSEEQRAAVVLAASRPFAAITGGPGTGKTSTVLALLRTLVALGVPPEAIALAAPTGRAAHRLDEALRSGVAAPEDPLGRCRPPETLHRLLGYNPGEGRFRHHDNDRLPARAIIVDEASMIDLSLADALVRAVRDDARLVLLGDAHQLPSVDAGAVFRDVVLAGEGAGWVARLTRSFRVADPTEGGATLLAAAAIVNSGKADALFAGPASRRIVHTRARVAELTFAGVELSTGEGDADPLVAFLDRWFGLRVFASHGFERRARAEFRLDGGAFTPEAEADVRWLLEHHGRHRLLTVTRGPSLATGADRVNAHLHRALLARMRPGPDPDGRPAPAFFPGEPVLVTQNDYARDLFNGDQGVVLRVATRAGEPHHFMAIFPRGDRLAAFPIEALRGELALGFAMTVHKAQGSEFDHVALILPERPLPMLTREIVYTALTRARRAATVVGTRAVLTSAVERKSERFSGVARKLGTAT